MIVTSRLKTSGLMGIIFLLLFAIPACANNQIAAQKKAKIQHTDSDDLLRAFEQEHATIVAQVRMGELPEEVGAKANELNITLKKYLIETNAKLQIFELDVLHLSGEKREAALNKMMELTAERERTKMDYLLQLQALKNGNNFMRDTSEPSGLPQKTQNRAKKTKEEGSGTKWRTKTLDIEIEIAPEDLSKGTHD